MEVTFPKSKRVKLEHSYANLMGIIEFEPVKVKEEDPLTPSGKNDVVETIKIEIADENIDNLIKSEPIEEVVNDEYTFEYMAVQNIREQILPDQNIVDDNIVQTNLTKSEVKESFSDEAVESTIDRDPLELVNYGLEIPDLIYENDKSHSEKGRLDQKNLSKDVVDSKTIRRLQREKENVQNQLKKLRGELKAVKAREKALQMELGARRMSEVALEKSNAELSHQLLDTSNKLETSKKDVSEMVKLVAQHDKQHALQETLLQRLRKEYNTKLEQLKGQLKSKNADLKKKEIQWASLRDTLVRLTKKFDTQKQELEALKKTTASSAQANQLAAQSYERRVKQLSKELAQALNAKEELQKALLSEKKMSRFFVKERDQLLEEQSTRFREADKELMTLKQSVGSLTAAVTRKVAECKAQKEASRVIMATYQKKNEELRNKLVEMEKQQNELSKKTCEYCGF